jgi:SepF-like predicted cell division protein (DUF552 family)
MPFNLLHKNKQREQEKPSAPPSEPNQETLEQTKNENTEEQVTHTHDPNEEPNVTTNEPGQENNAQNQAQSTETISTADKHTKLSNKTYLKAMPLRELSDVEKIKNEVRNGNIIILRITPLASKSIEDVKSAVNELFQFAESISGDIARLGEERVVICPKTIRIWREKSPVPVKSSSEPLSTAA